MSFGPPKAWIETLRQAEGQSWWPEYISINPREANDLIAFQRRAVTQYPDFVELGLRILDNAITAAQDTSDFLFGVRVSNKTKDRLGQLGAAAGIAVMSAGAGAAASAAVGGSAAASSAASFATSRTLSSAQASSPPRAPARLPLATDWRVGTVPLDFGNNAVMPPAAPGAVEAADKVPASPPVIQGTPPIVWIAIALVLGYLVMG